MVVSFSPRQRDALQLIAKWGPVDGQMLATHLGTSEQGAHMTMASLVRAGVVVRFKDPYSHRIRYRRR